MGKKSKKHEVNRTPRTIDNIDPKTTDGSMLGVSGPTIAGTYINEYVAMNIAAVYACVTLRAQIMACLPIGCFKKKLNGDRDLADQHPSYNIWNKTPDQYMNSFNVRESVEGHKLLRGNAYFETVRNFRGQVVDAYLLDPRRMSIVFPSGQDRTTIAKNNPSSPIYQYTNTQAPPTKMDRTEVLHFANWSNDGLIGVPPLTVFRESMGLTVAANSYASEYFRKGGYPLGFLTKPGVLGEKQRDSILDEWDEMHGGVHKSHNVGILSGGLGWQGIGVNNTDAQLLGLRQFQKEEMGMIFRIPPFLIGNTDKPLNEFSMIQLIIYSIIPEMKRNENEMNNKMFTPKERAVGYYMEYNADAMLRGDSKSRAEALQIQHRDGVLLTNEWRHMENRNSVEHGDVPLVMASQLATLEAVATGKANLDTTNKTAIKTKKNIAERMVNRIKAAYLKLDPADRRRVQDVVIAMNGVAH